MEKTVEYLRKNKLMCGLALLPTVKYGANKKDNDLERRIYEKAIREVLLVIDELPADLIDRE